MLNKLVRDKIVADQLQSGQNPVYHKLASDEHIAELLKKLLEEAQEIPADNQAEAVKEIADVRQVLEDLQRAMDISDAEVERAKLAKHAHAGGFELGLFVESVSPSEDNQWTTYYRSEPERFMELSDDGQTSQAAA